MKTVFYLTQKDVAKALEDYIINSFCYCDDNYKGEIVTTVEDICTVPSDKYAAYVTVRMEKE